MRVEFFVRKNDKKSNKIEFRCHSCVGKNETLAHTENWQMVIVVVSWMNILLCRWKKKYAAPLSVFSYVGCDCYCNSDTITHDMKINTVLEMKPTRPLSTKLINHNCLMLD